MPRGEEGSRRANPVGESPPTVPISIIPRRGMPSARDPALSNLGFGVAPRPARDALIGQLVAGRFKVEELIGQGGMGKVYRARHLALDRLVCLKMLRPARLEDPPLAARLAREAKARRRLTHPSRTQRIDYAPTDIERPLYH